ncbi:MAG: SUF system NifU family Fe-S cluster assembly protein [Clostridiales bacterium]|nr:SUF system NifU family Fe-S cluster assembly protein [Clostridiales bacterium]
MGISKEEMMDIYKQVIIENTKEREHKKIIEGISKEGINPSCGDELKIYVKIDRKKKIIEDISFTGRGCAISEASANIMAEILKGKTKKEAKKIINTFFDMIKLNETDDEKLMEILGDAYAFKNISYMPSRVKCAFLGWKTLEQILEEIDKNESSVN